MPSLPSAASPANAATLQVETDPGVLQALAADAVAGLEKFRHGGVEVGGLLYGYRSGSTVHVLASRPFTIGYTLGPTFRLTPAEEEAFAALRTQTPPGLEPVGWYHTHTRSALALSDEDAALHQRLLPEPWAVALLLRPGAEKEVPAGYFARNGAGVLDTETPVSFLRVTRRSALDAAPGQQSRPVLGLSPEQVGQAAAGDLLGLTARPVRPPVAPPPFTQTAPPARRSWWRWLLSAGLLGAAGLLWWHFPPRVQEAPVVRLSSLQLRVLDQNGRLAIRWDQTAPLFRAGASGLLRVQDAAGVSTLRLTSEQLRNGLVEQPRRGERVRIVLRVVTAEGRSVEETATLLAMAREPEPPEAPAPAVASARPVFVPQPLTAVMSPAAERTLAAPPPPVPLPLVPPDGPVTLPTPGLRELPRPAPAMPAPATPTKTYTGPERGRLIWTGALPAGGTLTINGGQPSAGSLVGRLPGVPVRIAVRPGELRGGGLLLYTSERTANGGEQPSAANGWNATRLRHDPARANSVVVTEPPGFKGRWDHLAVHAGDGVGVLIIDWAVADNQ